MPRALALQRSIARHCPEAVFGFFCIDDAAADLLHSLDLDRSWIVTGSDFETDSLRALRATVKLNEYCWACKPVALRYALVADRMLDWAVWLDADMLAFGDLDSALAAKPNSHVALTPHDFSSEFAHLEPVVGRFNAGYVAFRNTNEGRQALDWWFERCMESCPATPTEGRYADQKYLDGIATRFDYVAQLSADHVNAAPWNAFRKPMSERAGQVLIDRAPLLLFHFQGLKIIRHWLFDLYASANVRLSKDVRKYIYAPYVTALSQAMADVSRTAGNDCGIDREFVRGWSVIDALKRLSWSKNMTFHWPSASGFFAKPSVQIR